MTFRSIILGIMVLTGEMASGQYFQYSQYNFTSQRVNPAMVAASSYASLGLIYRQQHTGAGVNLKSSMVSGTYPLLTRRTGKRWAGIGMTAMDDRANAIFSTQEASLSYALNVYFNRFTTLSLGMKALYQQRSINLDGLFTGLQYIPDRGFDRSMDSGESMQFLRSDFFTFSSGLYWQQTDRTGNRIAWWGASLFDFNKPDDSFADVKNELGSTLVFHAGVQVYRENQLAFIPEILFTRSTSTNLLNVGAVTSYFLNPSPRAQGVRIDILTKYVAGRSGILGLQWHSENFSAGCSYDFPIGKKNVANSSAFEVGVELRRLVDHRLKRKTAARKKMAQARARNIVTKKKSIASQANKPSDTNSLVSRSAMQTDSNIDSVTNTSSSQKTHTDLKSVLQHKQDSVLSTAQAGMLSHEPFLIETATLHFNFEFNSSNLDEASAQYLDELSEALSENAHLRIRLTGHTDNIGSEKFNQRLSLFRANAIREYLIETGIDPERIETEGKGMEEPLNENKTEEERAINRRVELMIMYED